VRRHASIAAVAIVLCASAGYAQTRDAVPDFRVEVVGYIGADFHTRVWR
jgi:hypothetical protein